ncbi:hypothetical protein AALP_AA3G293400 [Arabis alpina]|uniref:Uncharacterized protein n=1 Tax=Arabis alpina TaxID=50452 RepID=A0A087HCH5_ARAAL|nr:hypothetical protein AALP_AA3G293400 [Arabis alpina]
MGRGADDTMSNRTTDDKPSSPPSSRITEDQHASGPAEDPDDPFVVCPEGTYPMISADDDVRIETMSALNPMTTSSLADVSLVRSCHAEDPSLEPTSGSSGTGGVTKTLAMLDADSGVPRPISPHDPSSRQSSENDPTRSSGGNDTVAKRVINESVRDDVLGEGTFVVGVTIPLNDEDPDLPSGNAFVSSSSSSSGSSVFSDGDDDEDMSVEVERTKKFKKIRKKAKSKVERTKKFKKIRKKAKSKVSPDPPGSSLSKEKSLRRLRKDCGISEEIELLVPTPADRADAPLGYMTLFENFFDQCLLWFPLPRFLMRFLAVNGVCLAQINPRGIRHLLGIYVLSRECGVDISTENLSYLTDFRARGLSEELKYSVANSMGMALIAGFPSKDDHFEYRFFFAELSERTVEEDCIDLVKTRWERRVKPTMPKVLKYFLAAMHKELSSGNGNWKRSFSRKRIERALSAEILPRKVLGRGQARLSLREQIALEAAAKARGSSGTGAPRVAMPTTLTPPPPSTRARTSRPSALKTALPPPSSGDVAEFRRLSAERACISSGKGKGVDRVTPSKRQRTDAFPAAAVGGVASASGGDELLRAEAYSVVKSRYSELSLLFDRLVGDYDEDVRSRGSELSAAKEANAALQSKVSEIVERNEALERDALALQRVKKDYEDKLSNLKSRCAKAEGETVRLRGELSFASDLQRSRIDAAVAEARDEMTRSFVERTSEVAGLLAEIGGKAQNDMLNLTEIDANLEFIGLLQGSDPPYLPTEVETLRQRHQPIYDAHDVFADLLTSVRRVLEIPTAPAGAVDDDVELSDEDDVEATGDEGADD